MAVMGWLRRLMGLSSTGREAHGLYAAVVEVARDPVLYRDAGVPDTLEGRFAALCLVMSLVYQRIDADPALRPAERAFWNRAVTEGFVEDMDRSLREQGVGDMSVGKKVRALAAALAGQAHGYDAARQDQACDTAWRNALVRNLYASEVAPDGLEAADQWCRQVRAQLGSLPSRDLLQGRLEKAMP